MTAAIKFNNGYKFPNTDLIYLSDAPSKKFSGGGTARMVYCKCVCGMETIVQASHVTRKRNPQRSCGCLKGIPLGMYAGSQIGSTCIKFLRRCELKDSKRPMIVGLCECGNEVRYRLPVLLRVGLNGKQSPQSCACSRAFREFHEYGDTRLYSIWSNMKCRIYRESSYYNKNIKVCDDWQQFTQFRIWALSNGYCDSLTLERKHIYKDYEPSNCIFIPLKDQVLNTTRTIVWTVDGVDYIGRKAAAIANNVPESTIAKWCEKTLDTQYDSTN